MTQQLVDEVLAITTRALRDLGEVARAMRPTPPLPVLVDRDGDRWLPLPDGRYILGGGQTRTEKEVTESYGPVEREIIDASIAAEMTSAPQTSPGGGEDVADASVPSAAGAPTPGDSADETTLAVHRIAGSVLWRHRRLVGRLATCACGWAAVLDDGMLHQYNAHVVEQLAAAGVLGVAR